MKSRALLFGILLALVAVGSIVADNQAPPPAAATPSAAAVAPPSSEPAPDPFFGVSDVSSTKDTHIVCICQQGVNCCPDTGGLDCGIDMGCRCKANGVCTKRHH